MCPGTFSTPINLVDKDAHARPVEWSNRTVKERVRCLIQILPVSWMSSFVIKALLDDSIQILNRLPRKLVFPSILVLPPLSLVHLSLIFKKLKLSFGEHAEFHEHSCYQTNSENDRGILAVTLKPVHDSSRTYYFYSLFTGSLLMWGQWTINPMPSWVINWTNDAGSA